MFNWKKEYELGVEMIDEQHKVLFSIAGRAYELMKNDFYVDKFNKIVEIIEELKNYTIFHFKAEEEYMMSIGYRKLLSHKVEHDDFIAKFKNLDFDTIDHRQDEYIEEILTFVFKWITEHILVRDRAYTNF